MKFTLLDSRVADSKLHDEDRQQHPQVKYQYLDDLLDKTFLVDYFMVHTDSSSTSNK
jgi:hypothetical protein